MIICITGPTAVGKTTLSLALAKLYNAQIINADSAQVYKELNIGTAKIKEEEKDGIIHHLFDVVDIKTNFSVFEYQKEGRLLLDKLVSENKNVIIVGGTGLYIKALLYDYRFNENDDNQTYDELTNLELYEKVLALGNDKIDINNRQRLVSYLNNYDANKEYNKNDLLYDVKFIGLTTNRELLYSKINYRVDNMFEDGLLEEVKALKEKYGINNSMNRIIGYKEVLSYLNNELSYEECLNLIKKNSRHYAKRQFTWFNNQMTLNNVEVDYEDFSNTIEEAVMVIENG